MRIGGLDVGTTGVKLAVYDGTGRPKGVFYREYAAREDLGRHEMDFGALRTEVFSLLREALAAGELDALGVTSFGETFALLDRDDEILFPSLLYTDPRGEEETKRIGEKIGRERYMAITGVAPQSMYSIGKLLYRKEEDPDRFARAEKILLGQDYVVYLLTGERKIDYTLAARTGAFDVEKKTWSREILGAAGIDEALFSTPVETGSVAGVLLPAVREELGAKKSFPVISAAHDQVAAMIGSGVFDDGRVMDGTGTVECIPLVLKEKPLDPAFYEKGYSAVPYLGIGYACYAFSFTGGAMLKWFRDNFAEKEREEAEERGESVYALLDRKVSREPSGLLVLPHFAGAATPYMDIAARAAVVGMTLETTKTDLYRALMEGTSYEMRLNFDALRPYVHGVRELRATGGGAKSDLWLSIKADVLGVRIAALACDEVGAAGTAALAGTALGIYSSLREITAAMAPVRKLFLPDGERKKTYDALYARYAGLYKAVKGLEQER